MARSGKPKAQQRPRGASAYRQDHPPTSPKRSSAPSAPSAGLPHPERAALVIFAKAPIPGKVKTRLCPPLTEEEAATLHGSLVLDVLERTVMPGMDRFMACAPSAEHVFFKILEERHGVRLLTQTDGDLGHRMHEALAEVLSRGYRKVLLIGADVPAISRPLLSQALGLLGAHDVVLGPAVDGGYYLIGLMRLIPELFANMPWSSDRVCTMTEEKARVLQLTTGLLPRHRDLDTVQDLLALVEDAGLGTNGPIRDGVLSKRTAGVLRVLMERIQTRRVPGPGASLKHA
jgi:rSAM/selenodomain-associated transferase 1